jgi:CspA family cold shock protein
MPSGTVKWYNSYKGYGFIQPDSDGKDVFVQKDDVASSGLFILLNGEKVDFDIAMAPLRKTKATNIKPATPHAISVLFVDYGNICRSPMAEAVFRHYVSSVSGGLFGLIDSCGISESAESGDRMDERTESTLRRHLVPPNAFHISRTVSLVSFHKSPNGHLLTR